MSLFLCILYTVSRSCWWNNCYVVSVCRSSTVSVWDAVKLYIVWINKRSVAEVWFCLADNGLADRKRDHVYLRHLSTDSWSTYRSKVSTESWSIIGQHLGVSTYRPAVSRYIDWQSTFSRETIGHYVNTHQLIIGQHILQTEVGLWPDVSCSHRAWLHQVCKSDRGQALTRGRFPTNWTNWVRLTEYVSPTEDGFWSDDSLSQPRSVA